MKDLEIKEPRRKKNINKPKVKHKEQAVTHQIHVFTSLKKGLDDNDRLEELKGEKRYIGESEVVGNLNNYKISMSLS